MRALLVLAAALGIVFLVLKASEYAGLASEGKSTEGRAHAGGPDETEPTEDAEPTDTTEDAEPGAQGKAKADEASEGKRAQGGEKRP